MFVVVFLGLIVWWRAAQEWQRIERVPLGDYVGPATLVGDPSPFGAGVRAVFRIDGWRYEASFYGSDARRVLRHPQGETVQMSARREALSGDAMRRKQVRHIAGRLVDVELGTEWTSGSALTRATNRLRRLVASGTAHLPSDDAALALGLLIGDDRAQPRAMIDAFRDSGLSHLTAVSGQNIAFVLAASAPLLTRLGPGKRLAATWAVIAVFALITRAEPSVIRAAAMAGTTALCFTRGWNVTSRIVLVASATVLVIVDPMLLWSVGFWLSVGATAGLVFLSAPIARGLRRARSHAGGSSCVHRCRVDRRDTRRHPHCSGDARRALGVVGGCRGPTSFLTCTRVWDNDSSPFFSSPVATSRWFSRNSARACTSSSVMPTDRSCSTTSMPTVPPSTKPRPPFVAPSTRPAPSRCSPTIGWWCSGT
jgi:ComEC/Rec2-related protein